MNKPTVQLFIQGLDLPLLLNQTDGPADVSAHLLRAIHSNTCKHTMETKIYIFTSLM